MPAVPFSSRALVALGVALLAGGALVVPAIGAADPAEAVCACQGWGGDTSPMTFAPTGAVQSWVVPAGVSSIEILASGGQGGRKSGAVSPAITPGAGAVLDEKAAVTPGQVLDILVGDVGQLGLTAGGGGGGSFVWSGTTPLVVAGGGGGVANSQSGSGGAASLLDAGGDGGLGFGGRGGTAGSDGASGASLDRNIYGPSAVGGAGGLGWNSVLAGATSTGGAAVRSSTNGSGGGGYSGGGGGGCACDLDGGGNSASLAYGGGGGGSYVAPGLIDLAARSVGNTGAGAVTITALTPQTVTFDARGHGATPAAQQVGYGATATAPAAPTADGFTFGGWFTDAATTQAYDFSTPVTGPLTLYAKWSSVAQPAPGPSATPLPIPTLNPVGSAVAGQSLHVTGSGFAPGAYDVVLHSTPVTLGTTTVGAGGVLDVTVAIPADAAPGAHTLLIEQGGVTAASVPLTLAAATALAETGTNPAGPLALGLGLAALGALALALAAGRRSSRTGRGAYPGNSGESLS